MTRCDSINNKYTHFKRFRRYFCSDLGRLKAEISGLTKSLTPKIIKCIQAKKFPFLQTNQEISQLVFLRQKYIALLSKRYGMYSKEVQKFFIESVTKIEMRVFAIEKVYQLVDSKIFGIDGVILTHSNRLSFLSKLQFTELNKYVSQSVRLIYVPKVDGTLHSLGIPTIFDRLVQTLFVLLLDPLVDNYCDYFSFGFRKSRSAHQAVGQLSEFLSSFGSCKESSKFNLIKFILKFKVSTFFGSGVHC